MKDAWNRRFVVPASQVILAVWLLVELEAVGVADAVVVAVADIAVERFTACENFAAGEKADFVSRAVDILYEHVMDGAERDGGKSPIPSVKGDEIVACLAFHAADNAVGGGAVDVDAVHLPKDKEELALPLSGRKTKLRIDDFLTAAKTMGLEEIVVQRLVKDLHKILPRWQNLIHDSFLSEEMKEAYEDLMVSRLDRLNE